MPAEAPPTSWTLGRVLDWTRKNFADRGLASPRLDAEVLLAHALGISRVQVYTRHDQPLDPQELKGIRDLVERRRAGEPVAYIVGSREFYRRSFQVDRRVLIPRPETETLVETALESLGTAIDSPDDTAGARTFSVLDVGTGSGAIAITLALERNDVIVTAIDVSDDALAVARANAERLGAAGKIRWLLGSLYGPLEENARFDLIVSNPPYVASHELETLAIDVRAYEPVGALVGGPEGTELIAHIVQGAVSKLTAHGTLLVEIGHEQADRVRALASRAGFTRIEVRRDLAGIERILVASRDG